MSKNFYKLNVDFNFLSNENLLDSPRHFNDLHERWLTDSVNTDVYLSAEMRLFLLEHNVNIYSYMGDNTMSLFRGQPNGYLEPHIDRGTCWAINYIIGKDSEMIWYSLNEGVNKSDGYEIPTSYNKNATFHAYYYHQLTAIEREKLNGLYLVRIDIPHSIHNYDDIGYRWCFSLKDARNKWTWEETINNFKDYITL